MKQTKNPSNEPSTEPSVEPSAEPTEDVTKDLFIEPPKPKIRMRTILILMVIIGLAVWFFLRINMDQETPFRTETVSSTDLIQEVSVTGTVMPAETVSLGFEVSGRVAEIFADIGDRVQAGDKLISLTSSDLQAQLRQAQAGLSSASALRQQYEAALAAQQAKLDEMRSGTRTEEIQIAETTVQNAERDLEDAKRNLEVAHSKVEADLNAVYNDTLLSMLEAVVAGKQALVTISGIQLAHFTTSDSDRFRIEQGMADATYYLLGEANAGSKTPELISRMTGGTFGEVQKLGIDATHDEIARALDDSLLALQKVKFTLDSIPIKNDFTEAEILSLDTHKSKINGELTALSNHKNQIAVQKVNNDNLINAAETEINRAQNALNAARDQLLLKKAGYTQDQLKAQEAVVNQATANLASARAQVSQAYANVQNYQAQLAKTVLYAPITGLVTKMAAKVGEIVFPSSPYSDSRTTFVSIISDVDYEIEANVAEVDIAKITVGDPSLVTLDAYGDDQPFEAKVVSIDPGETVIEGIPTYKVTLQFVDENIQVRPGMTANLDIRTDMREGVITIPQRAIITQGDRKIVRVVKQVPDPILPGESKEEVVDVEVVTGLKGSDGRTEILEGLAPGDVIVISEE